jgi:hypothetical protein
VTAAFWVDDEYDRDHASDGVSRYVAYIRDVAFEPWTDDDQRVELAAFAWDRATGPVMSPGYVRRHPRILTAQLARSDWDGSLIAQVDVLTPQPHHLRIGVKDIGYWHDWPSEHAFGADRIVYFEPGTEDLARSHTFLLAGVSLPFMVPSGDLPYSPAKYATPTTGTDLVVACQQSIAVLVRELNRIAGPVINHIEGN